MPEPKITTDAVMAWYYSGLTVLAGLLLGLIADFVLRRYVHKLAARTAWEGDEMIIIELAKKMPLWGLLGGLLVTIPFMPLSPKLIFGFQRASSVLLILSVTWTAANIVGGLIGLSAGTAFGASTSIFRVLAKVGVWGIGISVTLNQLGISIAPLLTALGVGGLAVALALQDTLSNLFAGIHIILSKQVRVGDYIKLESGAEGFVTDINWRNTTIRALANNMVVIPNSKLASAIATNFNMPDSEMAVSIPVGVAYNSDLEKVERITLETATEIQTEVEGALSGYVPSIRFHTFGENSIQFSVNLRVREFTDQYLVKHEFTKKLHNRYKAEGIEFPLPQRTLSLHKDTVFRLESAQAERRDSTETQAG